MKINLNTLKIGSNKLIEDINPHLIDVDDVFCMDELIHIDLDLFLSETQIDCHGKMSFSAMLTCDRCLTEFYKEITVPINIYFSHSIPEDNTDENAFHWSSGETIINMSPVLRDLFYLSIPQKILCSENCKGICVGCGANLNTEVCTCESGEQDERFLPLLTLKSKLTED